MVVDHTVSFLHLPNISIDSISRFLFGPEIKIYNWIHSFFPTDHSDTAGEWTFVDYYAASCPHCVKLAPVWDDAKQVVNIMEKNGELPHVNFVQKECYGENWAAGKDAAECAREHIEGFPTLKLIGPRGDVLFPHHPRNLSSLVDFIKQETKVPLDQPTMVDYMASSCPHCKVLNPAWDTASHAYSGVLWQQKECLDHNWQPGKDFAACNHANIEGFPTIKLIADGKTVEYHGDRSAESLVRFAKENMGDAKIPSQDGQLMEGSEKTIEHAVTEPEIQMPGSDQAEHAVLKNAEPVIQLPMQASSDQAEHAVLKNAEPEIQMPGSDQPEHALLKNAEPEVQMPGSDQAEHAVLKNAEPEIQLPMQAGSDQAVLKNAEPVIQLPTHTANAAPSFQLPKISDADWRAKTGMERPDFMQLPKPVAEMSMPVPLLLPSIASFL